MSQFEGRMVSRDGQPMLCPFKDAGGFCGKWCPLLGYNADTNTYFCTQSIRVDYFGHPTIRGVSMYEEEQA